MPRPDRQINDVIFWRPQVLHTLAEVTSRDNCYFPGAEAIIIFLRYPVAVGVIDVDMKAADGSWLQIKTQATVAGDNVIKVEHGLYKSGQLRLRFTPGAANQSLSAYGTGYPTVMSAPNVRANKLGSYTSEGSES